MNRKDFLRLSGLGIAAAGLPSALRAESAPGALPAPARTGNGEWVFESVPGWGALPATESIAPTHGGIAQDKAGNIYVNTDGPSGTLVYGPDGRFVKGIAQKYTGIHSMQIVEEGGEEFIYASWLVGQAVIKLKLDGSLVAKIDSPPAAAMMKKKWKPTATVVGPDGTLYVCDGYGDSRIHIFDKNLEWKRTFGSYGTADGQFRSSHGLTLDTRGKNPLLMVADRENHRLSHYDLEGKFVEHRVKYLRRPCQVSFHGKMALVSEIHGRATILDGDDAPVAFLGDNPDHNGWDNYTLDPSKRKEAVFNALHGAMFAPNGDLYFTEWSLAGRVCKLVRAKA